MPSLPIPSVAGWKEIHLMVPGICGRIGIPACGSMWPMMSQLMTLWSDLCELSQVKISSVRGEGEAA